MQATQVTIDVAGDIITKEVELQAFTRRCILGLLGVVDLDPMSSIERRSDGSFVVCIAQDKPWTWVKHVFVA